MSGDALRPDAFRRSWRAGRVKSAASFTRREQSHAQPVSLRASMASTHLLTCLSTMPFLNLDFLWYSCHIMGWA
jgi:hypothetical protein